MEAFIRQSQKQAYVVIKSIFGLEALIIAFIFVFIFSFVFLGVDVDVS